MLKTKDLDHPSNAYLKKFVDYMKGGIDSRSDKKMSIQRVEIDKSSLIGKGLHRECYRHPGHENRCIKVVVHGNEKEGLREKAYYRHLAKRGIRWDMLPRYHGEVETNLGPGSVFDLILDEEGSPSKNLEYYISSSEKTEEHYEGLSTALLALKEYLLGQRIITMTLKPKNILCQKDRSGISRLFVIDNIGNSDFIPICNYSAYLARKKISRKWADFEKKMLGAFKENGALRRMIDTWHRP